MLNLAVTLDRSAAYESAYRNSMPTLSFWWFLLQRQTFILHANSSDKSVRLVSPSFFVRFSVSLSLSLCLLLLPCDYLLRSVGAKERVVQSTFWQIGKPICESSRANEGKQTRRKTLNLPKPERPRIPLLSSSLLLSSLSFEEKEDVKC